MILLYIHLSRLQNFHEWTFIKIFCCSIYFHSLKELINQLVGLQYSLSLSYISKDNNQNHYSWDQSQHTCKDNFAFQNNFAFQVSGGERVKKRPGEKREELIALSRDGIVNPFTHRFEPTSRHDLFSEAKTQTLTRQPEKTQKERTLLRKPLQHMYTGSKKDAIFRVTVTWWEVAKKDRHLAAEETKTMGEFLQTPPPVTLNST